MSVQICQVKTIKFGFAPALDDIPAKELKVSLDDTDMIESDMITVASRDLMMTYYTPTLIAGLIIDSYRTKLYDLLAKCHDNGKLSNAVQFTKILSIHLDKMSDILYNDEILELSYDEITRRYSHICEATSVIFSAEDNTVYNQLKSIFAECLVMTSLMETHRENIFKLLANFDREANGHMPSMNPWNKATDKTPNNTLGDKSKFVSVETQFGTEIDADAEADVESDVEADVEADVESDAETFSAITKINLDIPIRLDPRFRLRKASGVSYDILKDYPELIVTRDVTEKELTLDYLHQQLVKVLCVQRELDGYRTLINMAIKECAGSNCTPSKTEEIND